jgi:membrane protease YdiL (CAAX protease family)
VATDSLAEFLVGAAIVIGHNVYHVIPDEVSILFVLGLISLRVRDGGWKVIGLRWPFALKKTVLLALTAAAVRILLGSFCCQSSYCPFLAACNCTERMNDITGHIMVALKWFAIVWTFAAFGEEISYRGICSHALLT